MKIWVDAQLSPAIAQWLAATQGVEASAVRDLGLRHAEDSRIFFAARQQGAVIMSKDREFVDLAFVVLSHNRRRVILRAIRHRRPKMGGEPDDGGMLGRAEKPIPHRWTAQARTGSRGIDIE